MKTIAVEPLLKLAEELAGEKGASALLLIAAVRLASIDSTRLQFFDAAELAWKAVEEGE